MPMLPNNELSNCKYHMSSNDIPETSAPKSACNIPGVESNEF